MKKQGDNRRKKTRKERKTENKIGKRYEKKMGEVVGEAASGKGEETATRDGWCPDNKDGNGRRRERKERHGTTKGRAKDVKEENNMTNSEGGKWENREGGK